jgi:hypothetical protein
VLPGLVWVVLLALLLLQEQVLGLAQMVLPAWLLVQVQVLQVSQLAVLQVQVWAQV